MIRIEHLEKEFKDGGKVLKDVNCIINDGDVVAIIGPSGTGKSTLLRTINMLDPPTGGKIFLDNDEITDSNFDLQKVHKKIHMVFQSFNLFDHLTVIENVMLPQKVVLKRSKQECYDEGMHFLQKVGLAGKAYSYPEKLSGGQKQRVAIARTLAMNPEIILLDEPTSALDPTTVDEVKNVIINIAKSGTTIIMVTHDMELAKTISNRVFYMDEGVIYEEGTPKQIFDCPGKEKTRKFIRKYNVLEENICDKEFDYPGLLSKITLFCNNHQLSPVITKKLHTITEEIVCSILFESLIEPFDIDLRYDVDADNTAKLIVTYGGDKLNILEEDSYDNPLEIKSLARKIIKHSSYEIRYTFEEKNKIEIFVVNC